MRGALGSRICGSLLVLLAAAGAGSLASAAAKGVPPPNTLPRADRLYAEKSYGAAAKAYQQLLAAKKIPDARRDEVEYRVGVSLGKAKAWDTALQRSLAFVKEHRGTIWEPRGLYWLGRLYVAVPHNGWRVPLLQPGGAGQFPIPNPKTQHRIVRGDQVPQLPHGGQPEQVWLQEQDLRNALDALEAARVLYPRFRQVGRTPWDEIQLNYDLLRLLDSSGALARWAEPRNWKAPADPVWKVDATAAYTPEWPFPKKAMFLLEQIQWLGRTLPEPRRSETLARAQLAEANWLRGYQIQMTGFAVRQEGEQFIHIPYPYEERKPFDLLRQIVRSYPNLPIRDEAQFLIGNWLEWEEKYPAAEREYRKFLAERPKSAWRGNALTRLAGITRRILSLEASPATPAGKPARIPVSYRNLRRLRFDVYRFDLQGFVTGRRQLAAPNATLHSLSALVGKLDRRKFGPRILTAEVQTVDRGEHIHRGQTFTLPLTKPGAYVIEASGPGVRSARLHLVTDLALVQKVHREGALLYAADARNGAPVAGARLWSKITWNVGGAEQSRTVESVSSREGTVNVPFPTAPGRFNFRISSVALHEGSYATADQAGQPGSEPRQGLKVYSVTDRSVYRPEQTVHYRQLVMRRSSGEWKPAAGAKVQVEIFNPRGERVVRRTTLASRFGSVNGELRLADGVPLGEYTVNVTLPAQGAYSNESGANRFRVEEYKKPEFEVTVEPGAERVRLGEKATAKVSARYYFGGPVPGAKVTYRVYRNLFTPEHRFPYPYDFLYRYWNEGNYQTDYRGGEVTLQGEARTNENGEAKIDIPTAVDKRWPDQDASYTVEADVQDSSRRVISGSGAVKATRHDVMVFLHHPRGYARKGEQLRVEVATTNPSDKPVSVIGTAVIYKQNLTTGKEVVRHEQPLKTDAEGRAYLDWNAPTGGYYRFEFKTRDSAEQLVSGSLPVWVEGPELTPGPGNLTVQPEKLYYAEGERAKVLLMTPGPGCTVLLTREANNEILSRQLVFVAGRSLEVTLPLTARDVPNVYVSAVAIRSHQGFQAAAELFVPPARQFAKVTVEADRERYQPGEKAKLRLQARDWQGRPLRTELSVAVTDAALGYIQKDYAPDIRLYFFGDRRAQGNGAQTSFDIAFDPVAEDTQPNRDYKGHPGILPYGMGLLPEWPGENGGMNMNGLGLSDSRGIWYTNGRSNGDVYSSRYRYQIAQQQSPFTANAKLRSVVGGIATTDGAPVLNLPTSQGFFAPYTRKEESSRSSLASDGRFVYGSPVRAISASELMAPTLRSHFADTAFWTPAAVTDAQGKASVEVVWPDNLTQWHANAVGTSAAAQVGAGETQVVTKKDVIVRLQAPRFFVERDEVVLSANVHNYLAEAARIKVELALEGDSAEAPVTCESPLERWVEVPKDGEARVDWKVRVRREGTLKVRMTARGAQAADATELSFPVLVHGVERQVAQSGVLRKERQVTVPIQLPAERKLGSEELVLQLSPSLAGVTLDALPYLADYPYGCIEQTMSRFLPSVVVAKTLKDLGYDLGDLRKRAKALKEKPLTGGVRSEGPYTYPKGRPGAAETPRIARWESPVFDEVQLRKMVQAGLMRIADYHHADGGWGWWKDDPSDPYMTAYVLYGLTLARDAGYPADEALLQQGLAYLSTKFQREEDPHRLADFARVLAMHPEYRDAIRARTLRRVYDRRDLLTPYSQALLALALHDLGEKEKSEILLRNLESTVKVDPENDTASWEAGNNARWWCWWYDRVETNAAVLQAYLAIRPNSELPPKLAKWLVNNRRGSIWQSTRDTALAVLSLSDYLRKTKELSPEYTATISLGPLRRGFKVTKENALFFDGQVVLPPDLLRTGSQPLVITKDGPGTLYYSAFTRYFSLEEPIRATGNEISVKRQYYRLIAGTASGTADRQRELDLAGAERKGNPFLTGRYELLETDGVWLNGDDGSNGPRYDRVPLREGETVASGDLLEVELQLESKNNYEYLVFEDLKPAGCEPVELRSGGKEGLGLYSNMELRDEKVAFFLSSLPQGTRTLAYRLRAEVPGRFHVLPTNGYAMYAPDIRTLSDERTLGVRDPEARP